MKYIFIDGETNFIPQIEAAGCFCILGSKVLYIKRHPSISQGNKWGIPAGKLEQGESALQGVMRELYEEVGIHVVEKNLQFIKTLNIRKPTIDYSFHIFCTVLESTPQISLALEECIESQWLEIQEIEHYELIDGGKEVLECYKNFITKK